MKKVALLFIVAMLLVMSSVVAYAAQPEAITLNSETDEITQISDSGILSTRKWIEVSVDFGINENVPKTIMYNAGGYTGILYYMYGYHDGNYYHALYSGWIYTGEVQPFSHVRY